MIATTWDARDRQAMDAAYRAEGGTDPIRWVQMAPWDDPGHLIASGRRVDLVAGWSRSQLTFFDAERWLEIEAADNDRDVGAVVRVLARPASIGPGRVPRSFPGGDPRLNPSSLAMMASLLSDGSWREGYARILDAAVDEANLDEETGPSGRLPESTRVDEVVARVRGSTHEDADRFLDLIRTRWGASGHIGRGPRSSGPVLRLEAAMIGATVVDAGEELRRAGSVVQRRKDRDRWRPLLTAPPPWPPASVIAMRADPDQGPLLSTLARTIVTDDEARAWLVASWNRPVQPIDRAFLEELSRVADGALVEEPRFLAWLRGEWTAWARQRYDAIARQAESGTPLAWSD